MQNKAFDPSATASTLLTAWRSGELLDALPATIKPETLEKGYAAQNGLFKSSGGKRAGLKLGVGSPAAMRSENLSRPLVGQLELARCHSSGVHLHMTAPTQVTIECEIAFILDRDLPSLVGRKIEPQNIRATCVTIRNRSLVIHGSQDGRLAQFRGG